MQEVIGVVNGRGKGINIPMPFLITGSDITVIYIFQVRDIQDLN